MTKFMSHYTSKRGGGGGDAEHYCNVSFWDWSEMAKGKSFYLTESSLEIFGGSSHQSSTPVEHHLFSIFKIIVEVVSLHHCKRLTTLFLCLWAWPWWLAIWCSVNLWKLTATCYILQIVEIISAIACCNSLHIKHQAEVLHVLAS